MNKQEEKSRKFWGVNCIYCEVPILVYVYKEGDETPEAGAVSIGLCCQGNPNSQGHLASDFRVFEVVEVLRS
jgi:hypothetical protein